MDVGDDPRDQVPADGLQAHLHEPLLRRLCQLLSRASRRAEPERRTGRTRGGSARQHGSGAGRHRSVAGRGRGSRRPAARLGLRLWGVAGAAVRLQHRRGRPLRAPRGRDVRAARLNPHYFANPPAFTYLLHFLFAVWLRGRRRRHRTHSPLHPAEVYTLARVAAAVLGTAALWLLYLTGARLFGRARRPARGGDRGGRLPARLLRAPGAQRRADARAADALAAGAAPACCAKGACATTSLAGVGLGLACATKYTGGDRRSCRLAVAGRGALSGRDRRARASGRSWAVLRSPAPCALRRVPGGEPLRAARLPALSRRTGAPVDAVSRSARASSARPKRAASLYYLWSFTWGLGWVPALAALGGAVALCGAATRRLGWLLVPRAAAVPRVHGPAGALLRALAAADLPDRCACSAALLRAACSCAGCVGRAHAQPGARRARRLPSRSRCSWSRAARPGARLQRALGPRAGARRHAQR